MTNGIKEKIENANKKAIDKVLTSNPILVDIKPAIDVVPGMKKNMIMHAGPPIDWQKRKQLRLLKMEKLNSRQTTSIML